MKLNEIMASLEKLSPKDYAMHWDNPGLITGRAEAEVSRIYIALDATEKVIEEAIDFNTDMLITHHPLIFSPVKQINSADFIGVRLLDLIENHINYYAMHTNFDVAVMGKIASDYLKLTYLSPLQSTTTVTKDGEETELGIGAAGSLPHAMSLRECGEYVKECFNIPSVKIFGNLDQCVSMAAVCPGSGKHMTDEAIARNCDVLITGDIDHHEGIDAVSKGITIIDAGHHGIEHIFTDYMKNYLNSEFPSLIVKTEPYRSPFTVI